MYSNNTFLRYSISVASESGSLLLSPGSLKSSKNSHLTIWDLVSQTIVHTLLDCNNKHIHIILTTLCCHFGHVSRHLMDLKQNTNTKYNISLRSKWGCTSKTSQMWLVNVQGLFFLFCFIVKLTYNNVCHCQLHVCVRGHIQSHFLHRSGFKLSTNYKCGTEWRGSAWAH